MAGIAIRSEAFDSAARVVATLRAEGFEAYFVGGCVRDLLLGREPADFDVATSARPQDVLQLFETTFAVGAQFGVVLVAQKASDGRSSIVTEVATYRGDGAYSDGRRPDEVRFDRSAKQDVQRRDFTINGMLLDPEAISRRERLADCVIDFTGGLADLEAGIVRAIGDPAMRFAEDKLRMLRAVRFASRFRFALDPQTEAAARRLAPAISAVNPERVRDELTKMLTEGQAKRAFELLDRNGLLQEILPEVTKMHGVEQPPEFHPEGDVWTHTMLLLEQLPAGCSLPLAWGTLLHDAGKPATFERAPDRIRFSGHVEVGVRIAQEICRRLRFSNEDTAQILLLIENHMRFSDVKRMKESTLKRFFRLPAFDEHLALHRMDCLAGFGSLDSYHFAKQRRDTLPPEHVRPVLLVTGKDLIEAGYRPGPDFKTMLAAAEDAQLEGEIHTREEGLDLVRLLRSNRMRSSSR